MVSHSCLKINIYKISGSLDIVLGANDTIIRDWAIVPSKCCVISVVLHLILGVINLILSGFAMLLNWIYILVDAWKIILG